MESINRGFLFEDVEFEAALPDPILGGLRKLLCSIGEVRGVVQVVQLWNTGIQIPSKSLVHFMS